ncbi:MAG TPA: membrane protein insertase YidC [Candidatus Kapabacteria bacterium]|nr:membrane protein insertase YidC [Candidatus Kapabacteria bacterium]
MQDTKAFIGFVIIGLLIAVWLWFVSPPVKVVKTKKPSDTTQVKIDSVKVNAPAAQADTAAVVVSDSAKTINAFGNMFARFSRGEEKDITIHTSLYIAVLSSHGGALKQFQLAQYKTWNGYPVQLIDQSGPTELNVLFESGEGKLISTKDLFFAMNAPTDIELHGDSAIITAVLRIDSVSSIEKRFTFHDGSYLVDADFIFNHCENVIGNYHYQITWDKALPFAEANSIDECNGAEAFAYQNGELESVDATKFDDTYKKAPDGTTDWVAARNKYFTTALIAPSPADGAYLEGKRIGLPDNGAKEEYNIALQFPYRKNAVEQSHIRVFLGPLDYKLVKGLNIGLDNIMSFGWAWLTRPIDVYFMIPVFNLIHMLIPNFGWVIVVFSLLIKALLYPFGIKQMRSAKRMQLMQPLMQEAKEKYKDDPTKMNQSVMRMYQEYGINPLSGCLPMILQMPILYAMWYVLRNSIQLRQQPFIWWIKDLSAPDTLINLPFTLPIFGMHQISGLAVMMGVAMLIQQQMTVKDPRQKAMVYMTPILMMLLFMGFPSGLNLYYLMFNLFSIGQQAYFNKRHSEIKLVPVVKTNGKSGGKMSFTQRLMETQKNMEKQRSTTMKQQQRKKR